MVKRLYIYVAEAINPCPRKTEQFIRFPKPNTETKKMGLSNFHGPAEGVLPILVMNTLMSLAILKNLVKSVLQVIGAASRGLGQEAESAAGAGAGRRRVSITQFKSPGHAGGRSLPAAAECSVCLSMFEEEEEVSELSCKHFFHRSCLDKWFDNHHSTCPLCRSIH